MLLVLSRQPLEGRRSLKRLVSTGKKSLNSCGRLLCSRNCCALDSPPLRSRIAVSLLASLLQLAGFCNVLLEA
eukprot:scaffold35578_cov56-Cyclotella_meneghiniana.AAC.3